MPFWLKPFIVAILVGAAGTFRYVQTHQEKIDRFFMALFRDLGRYKARKRRLAASSSSNAALAPLLTTLMGRDDPMLDLQIDVEDEDESNLPTYTKDELWEFGNGQDDDTPILLSLFGRVYDVSEGYKFYGPGAPYNMFAGRDVTYSLSTGCKAPVCLDTPAKLLHNADDIKEGKRWLSFFHLHDKYKLVGKMDGVDVNDLISKMVTETLQQDASSSSSRNADDNHDKDNPDNKIQSEDDLMKSRGVSSEL
jgi:predicted heme/steroid binding protein